MGGAEPQPLVQWRCALGLSLNLLSIFIDVMVFSERHMGDLLTKASRDARFSDLNRGFLCKLVCVGYVVCVHE